MFHPTEAQKGKHRMRTWTASIQVWDGRRTTTFAASDSEHDLLKDQTDVAVREAGVLVDDASEVHVTVWKQTKARGLEEDRTFYVFRDARGGLRYTR